MTLRILIPGIPILFLVLGVLKAWPFVDDLPLGTFVGDDWWTYKQHAVAVLREGLAMPSIGAYVAKAHGFLYGYFVAGVFSIFGENTAFVYVVQTAMVGASASVIYLAVRRYLSELAAVLFLVGSTLSLFIDFYRNLSFKLLSESLFLFLTAVFLLAYMRGAERRSHGLFVVAGILLGLVVLTRPPSLAAALAVMIVTVLWSLRARTPDRHTLPFSLAEGFVLSMAILPWREFAATGSPDLLLFTHTNDWLRPPMTSVAAFLEHYARRSLFTLGFTTFLVDEYRWRPIWFLIWIGFFGYLATWVRTRARPQLWEVAVLAFLIFYMGPTILMGYPENYGGRAISAVLPLVMLFAAIFGAELATSLWARRRAAGRPLSAGPAAS